jgi:hypothetical protein
MKSGINPRQISLERLILAQDVSRIKSEIETIVAPSGSLSGFSFGSGGNPQIKQRICPCCEEYIIPEESKNEKCPICGWIDDAYQNTNPDSLKGKNPISLNEAREAYRNWAMLKQ